jgi:hypothetical protein
MAGGVFLSTEALLLGDPEEVVRSFRLRAQEGGRSKEALALFLYPQGWRDPSRLIFSGDSIRLLEKRGIGREISFERAVSLVAVAQLLMRHAAVFARAIRRLERERGLTTEEALLAWACWEHGYGRLEEAPALERARIQIWAKNARDPLQKGRKVLSFVQEKAFQGPPDVSAWILRPPNEMGLRWPSAPQEVPDRTDLCEWLAVPSEEILMTLTQAAARKKRVTLILPGKPVAGLEFHADGLLRGFYDEGGSWRTDNWKDSKDSVIRFLAEEKAILRRAVVHAVAFRDLVESRGLKEAAHLAALAEYGFASLHDVPEAGRFLIQEATDRHLSILEIGTLVLERWREAPSAASRLA